ncbi:MAG: Glu/Leu/Phe/Val family dehydrogenase [Acidimicrobiales bacterium]
MQVFDRLGAEFEQVVACHEPSVGLRAIIAIHSTALGPSLGGTRFYPYRSEDQAMEDVLRLAQGMTYKSAAAGLDLGGGKAVILGDPATVKTEALLRTYGQFVESLSGRYITAEDVGTTQADMDTIFSETANVTGISDALGGSGDPSAATAYGVWWALKAVRQVLDGTDELAGLRVVVSGVGKVGSRLVGRLVGDGAVVTVADVNDAAVAAVLAGHGVAAVPVDEAHQVKCDVFSPCALGGVITERVIGELQCRAVAGAANNQLAAPEDGRRLAERGIVYAPDFVVNAGGVINITDELAGFEGGYDQERAYARVRGVYDTTLRVLQKAAETGTPANQIAEALAERRLAEAATGAPRIRTFTGTARRQQ